MEMDLIEVGLNDTSRRSGPAIALTGLIVPAQWDQQGRVTGVSIAGFDESEVRVSPGRAALGLARNMHRRVTVRGRLVGLEPDRFLVVDSYDILEEPFEMSGDTGRLSAGGLQNTTGPRRGPDVSR
jgi:hypothetical protein